jgi:hypothetical protein
MIEASEKHLWNTRILSCKVLQLLTPINSIDSCDQSYSMSSQGCDLHYGAELIDCHTSRMYCSLDLKIKTSHDGHFKMVGEDQDQSFQRDHHLSQYFGFLMSSQFLV